MKYLLVRPDNEVVGIVSDGPSAAHTANLRGWRVVEVEDVDKEITPAQLYLDGDDKPRKRVTQPSPNHQWDRATTQWVDTRTAAQRTNDLWTAVRLQRQALLRDCDWVVTRAAEEGSPVPKEWRDYRKALRDITTQPDPANIAWPTPPSV